jgi:hypothetical protein
MLPPDKLIAYKVALLEQVVQDILTNSVLEAEDPLAAVEQYRKLRASPASDVPDDFRAAYEGIWNEFLDRLSRQVGLALRERKR